MIKRKTFYKKAICYALMASLMTASLSGCGKKNKEDENNVISEAAKASKDYVFKSEEFDIGVNADNMRALSIKDGRVYAVVGDEGKLTKLTFVNFKPDGSDVKSFTVPESDDESHSYITYDEDDNVYCIYYKYDYSLYGEDEDLSDGIETEKDGEERVEEISEEKSEESSDEKSEEVAEENSEEAEETEPEDSDIQEDESGEGDKQYLIKLDANGKQLSKVDLSEYASEGYFSCNGMVYVEGYGLLICYDDGILSYNDEQGFKPVIKTERKEDDYSQSYTPYLGSDNKVYLTCYGDKGLEMHELDLERGEVREAIDMELNSYGSEYSFLQGEGYPLYVSDDDGVYGFDIPNKNLVKLMDYVDSDISIGYSISNLVAVSDTEFIALIPDADYCNHLTRLTKVPADQVKDKKIITLGGYYIDYDVRMSAIKFNKNSDEYKIKLVDYSSFDTEEDYEAGMNRFNLDIASGNIPDIMVFRANSPVDSYINKGLFEDLTGYFEKDPELSEEDFLTNVMEALKTNGKLYQIVPAFYVSTVTTKTKYLQGKDTLTFDDCKKLISEAGASYEFAFGIQQRNEMLETGLALAGNNYIDWENKSCSFNSESFIEFLEFTKNFPEQYKDDVWETYKETYYRDGQSLFNLTYMSDFRSYKRYKVGTFGEDISFIGFPNDMGVNCSVIYPECRIAISSKSAAKDGAWDYVKTFLSEEYQDALGDYNFPIRKSSFDKMGEESMHKQYYMDGDKKVEYDDTYYIEDVEVTIDPLTAEEVQEIKDFVGSLSLVYSDNASVNSIIEEEASAFYSGQKSAQEVADIIQSRVSIYVNENS